MVVFGFLTVKSVWAGGMKYSGSTPDIMAGTRLLLEMTYGG